MCILLPCRLSCLCIVLIILWTDIVHLLQAEEILGCGGFVKSDIDINFSRIEVKLYTKQGSLKYQTDCAPNNGYYLVPLYDKGEYVLKLNPPFGWSFEPEEVVLKVDGSSDPCSLEQDINFIFQGFAVTGKVISKGSSEGPAGVKVMLTTSDSKETLQETVTDQRGAFLFLQVLPGDYILRAAHRSWKFVTSEVLVHVARDNGNIGTSLIIAGYQVTGYVTSDSGPVKGVYFILFSDMLLPGSIEGCEADSVQGFQSDQDQLCHVMSDAEGKFEFRAVPPGDYQLVPYYKGEHIKFDVSPLHMTFTVQHKSLLLPAKFEVQGFSVTGNVLTSYSGHGVSNAQVFLNGKEQAVTNEEGVYHLESMKAGAYNLQAKLDGMLFDPVLVEITPNTPLLPDIIAVSFELCGQLDMGQLPAGIVAGARTLLLTPAESAEAIKIVTTSNGSFCHYVKPGKYNLMVEVTEEENKKGLKFSPLVQQIEIVDSPVSGIVLSQFRATITGKVICLSPCGNIPLSLQPERNTLSKHTTVIKEDGSFIFRDILPGRFDITVHKDDWCWEEKSRELLVTSFDVDSVVFRQNGFVVTVISSHETVLSYTTTSGMSGNLVVQKGTSKMCVSTPGVYEFIPIGCHTYAVHTLTWDSDRPSILTLTAIRHKFSGIIWSKENVSNVYTTVRISGNEVAKVGPLVPTINEGQFIFSFQYDAKAGDVLEIEPSAEKLLFYPPKVQLTMQNDCMQSAVLFEARMGLFINGAVIPPLDKVTVTISGEALLEAIVVETDIHGRYSVGPLHYEFHYEISAEKRGYIFSKLDQFGYFGAFKLAEVIVEVLDEESKPLPNVLVSLSGNLDYRQNSQTGSGGKMVFGALSPGDYFMRPMMKEYRFEPASKMVEVKEGETVELQVSGKRVAFSCYGHVRSLTGEPEPGVSIEAVGLGTCSEYQEEGMSEQDASFRIRGLIPQCEYEIRLMKGAEVNQHIERSTPRSLFIKVGSGDITNVTLIMFRYFNQMDITISVRSQPDYLKTLKVKLYHEDMPDSPLHVFTLDQSSFVVLPSLPTDNKQYFLYLDSSLPHNAYDYKSMKVAFKANMSYRHFDLNFDPRLRTVEQEIAQGSYIAFPVLIVIVLLALNYKKLVPVMSQASDMVQSLMTPNGSNGRGGAFMVEPIIKKKGKPRKI